MHEFMPSFETEEEFNAYFAKNTAIVAPHRDEFGMVCVKNVDEFSGLLGELGFAAQQTGGDLPGFIIRE